MFFDSQNVILARMSPIFFAFTLIFVCSFSFQVIAASRDEVVSQQLNCLEQKMGNGSQINWSDICAVQQPLADPYASFDDSPDLVKQQLDPRKTHTLTVDAQPFYYHYDEAEIGVYLKGIMMGYGAHYAYRPADSNVILNNPVVNTYIVEGYYAEGEVDYKGSGRADNQDNSFFDVRTMIGKDYLLYDRSIVTPYIGFGYRSLHHEFNHRQTTTGQWGYDRRNYYMYLPVGFYATIPGGQNWTGAFNLEYDVFLFGRNVSDLTSVNAHTTAAFGANPKFDQRKGYGVRASGKFLFNLGGNVDFFVEPFGRVWRIDDSEVVTVPYTPAGGPTQNLEFLEPKNFTYEVGSKFGIQF